MGLEYGRSWADQNCITPFTRFLAGHGDYTPLTLTPSFMGETSVAQQLGTAIIFNSPLMCYGGNPEDFIKSKFRGVITQIPPVWDETIVLPPSKIGDLAAFARRSGDKWFVAVIGNSAQKIEIKLDFLQKNIPYNVHEVREEIESERIGVKQGDCLKVSLNKSGGYCAIISQ